MLEESIFANAIGKPDEDRDEYLDEACGQDLELRSRVKALLEAHDNPLGVFAKEAASDVASSDPTFTGPPKRIGDFEILRELGRGGMGVVYEAKQISLNRRVALKVLSSGLGLTAKAILRFRREAEAAGKLHHTNIVPIYTTGEDRGIHFYAMELIEGPSLDHVIKHMSSSADSENEQIPSWVDATIAFASGEQSSKAGDVATTSTTTASSLSTGSSYFDSVASMIADVAEALEHAHNQGVIHRDVKPSNLLLSSDQRLSVNDFGLARVLEQPGMTITGEFVGSPLYMSPEQITAGRAPLDHRTDIYSLGATLYELLTREPPYPGNSRDQVIAQIMHKEPQPPRRINRRVPVDLETICLKAMEKDPDCRYQTAARMASDLRRYVNRHAISVRRSGPITRVAKFFRRNPSVAVITVLLLIVTIGAAAGVVQWQRREREQALQQVKEDLLEVLLRGDYGNADKLLKRGTSLNASQYWQEFSNGQIELYRGDYDGAKLHFKNALDERPHDVAAKALLAVANIWGGDEEEYFMRMKDLKPSGDADFAELFYLGYANCWGNPETAVKLLNQAEQRRPNHLLLRLFRGMALRFRAMEVVEVDFATALIKQALDDVSSSAGLLKSDTPLAVVEYVLANLVAANIHEKAGDLTQAKKYRSEAGSYVSQLKRFPKNEDARIALIYFYQQTGDDEAIITLADDLRQSEKVGTWTAQALGLEFFRLHVSVACATS